MTQLEVCPACSLTLTQWGRLMKRNASSRKPTSAFDAGSSAKAILQRPRRGPDSSAATSMLLACVNGSGRFSPIAIEAERRRREEREALRDYLNRIGGLALQDQEAIALSLLETGEIGAELRASLQSKGHDESFIDRVGAVGRTMLRSLRKED